MSLPLLDFFVNNQQLHSPRRPGRPRAHAGLDLPFLLARPPAVRPTFLPPPPQPLLLLLRLLLLLLLLLVQSDQGGGLGDLVHGAAGRLEQAGQVAPSNVLFGYGGSEGK